MFWFRAAILSALMLLAIGLGYRMGRARTAIPVNLLATQPVGVDLESPEETETSFGSTEPGTAKAPAKTSLIGSLRSLVETSPVFEQTDRGESLVESLIAADDILSRTKAQNRAALRQVNRQVRLGVGTDLVLITVRGLKSSDLSEGVLAGGVEVENGSGGATFRRQAVEFTQARAASPDPEQAWQSLMTGRLPFSRSGRDNVPTIGQILWRAGYATHFSGVWRDLSRLPLEAGYDHWFGVRLDAAQRLPDDWDYFSDRGEVQGLPASAAGLINASFSEGFHVLKESSRGGRPLFLQWSWALPDSSERTGAVEVLDDCLRQLTAYAVQRPESRKLLVLLTSELSSSAPLAGDELSEANLQVPLFVVSGEKGTGSREVDELVWTCDLLPTLAVIAGAQSVPPELAGRSFWPLSEVSAATERVLVWRTAASSPAQAARLDFWKGTVSAQGEVRLFDLRKDPHERINLADQHPEILRKLSRPATKEHVESRKVSGN